MIASVQVSGHIEIVHELLLQDGIDINIKDI